MTKIRIFDIEIGGVQRSIQNMDQLKQAVRDLKQIQTSSDFGSKRYRDASASLAALEATQQRARQSARDLVREKKAEDNTYRGLSARLNVLRMRYKDMAVQGKENTKEARAMRLEIAGLDNTLKRIDADVGQFQRNVGHYTSAFRGAGQQILRSFGVGSAATVLVAGIRNAAGVVADFDQAQADLASVTGKTREEIQGLTEDAKAYGATTAFTASEVSQLQLEMAKLGFTQEEIRASTKDVINFAIATKSEIPRAAALAGASLRAFNLEAEEMDRIVSVLGVSTTKSALDFSKLETALPKVQAVAAAFNFSIEDTVTLLGGLANAGFEASQIGTATRNILLNLADANGQLAKELGGSVDTFEELIPALQELDKRGINLNETLELTDKRSVAAFQTFLSGTDTLTELRAGLTGVNDELEEMAEKQLDSVRGKTKLLTSAWEGFILSIEDGEGALSDFTKGAITGLTSVLTLLTDINEGEISLREAFKESGGGAAGIFGITAFLKNIRDQIQDNETQSDIDESIERNIQRDVERLTKLKEGTEEEVRQFDQVIQNLQERANEGSENARRLLEAITKSQESARKSQEEVRQIIEGEEITLAKLRDTQKQLREELENLVPGTDAFIAKNEELESVTERISAATGKRIKRDQEFLSGSIGLIQQEIADQNQALIAATSDEARKAIDKTIKQLEVRLDGIKKRIEGITKADLDDLESGREESLEAELKLLDEITKREQLLRAGAAALRDEHNAGDAGIFEEDVLRQFQEGAISLLEVQDALNEARLKQEYALQQNILESSNATVDEKIEALEKLNAVHKELNAEQLAREEELNKSRQKYADDINNILSSAQDDFSGAITQLGNTISTAIDDEIITLKEGLEDFADAVPHLLTSITQSIASNIIQSELEASERIKENRIRDLEAIYDRKLELAQGDVHRERAIQKQLDKEREKIEKEAFEEQKRLKVKQAIINGILAASQTLANLGLPAAIPALIAVGIASALQVAQIKAVKFAEKGILLSINKGFNNHIRRVVHPPPYHMSDGGSVPIPGVARGRRHKDGGIKTILNGHPTEIEGGEFVDWDEHGNIVVINKTSTAHFRPQLQSMAGKTFAGKGKVMSDVNTKYGTGIRLAQTGAVIPGVQSRTVPAPVGAMRYIEVGEIKEAVKQGAREGALEGAKAGALEGTRQGAFEGSMEGALQGSMQGAKEGSQAGAADGIERASREAERRRRSQENTSA